MPTDNEIIDEAEDWLPHCVPFSGIEADQPLGILGLPAGIFTERVVKEVIIFDDSTEDGLKTIKVADLCPGMEIANVKFWEERIKAMLTGSGITVVDVDGKYMNREQWFHSISPVTGQERQTDALALWALRKLKRRYTGAGVQVQPLPGPFGVHATKPEGVGTVTTTLHGRQPVQLGDPRNR